MASGRAIAAQYRQSTPRFGFKDTPREISEVFARLDVFALTFNDDAAPYRYTLDDLMKTAPEIIPSDFDSIRQAHVVLVDLLRWMLILGSHIRRNASTSPGTPSGFEEQLAACRHRFCEWKQYWDQLILDTDGIDLLHVHNVDLWYTWAIILINAGFFGHETRYDAQLHHFERLVHLCEAISHNISCVAEIAAFSLDLGYLVPAFFCAIRCRDPQLRRRAIRVLESRDRREAFWGSTGAAAIATRWMQVEEEDLGEIASVEEVPESKRICNVFVQVNAEKNSAQVGFNLSSSWPATDRIDIREEIEWNRNKRRCK